MQDTKSVPRALASSRITALVLAAFFMSGACGLIHEVAWTRLLRHIMGNTTFSITTVLCAFMGGLALGSYMGGRFIDGRKDALRIFAVLESTIGIYCLLLPWLINWGRTGLPVSVPEHPCVFLRVQSGSDFCSAV